MREEERQDAKWTLNHPSDVALARRAAFRLARETGFDEVESGEIALAVVELATNLVRHAGGGVLSFRRLEDPDVAGRVGVEIVSRDAGPGIRNVEEAIGDGFSTGGSLGYGLGTINRLMDEFQIHSATESGGGSDISCRRWISAPNLSAAQCPLSAGVASRPHPKMFVNGDAFVVKKWNERLLIAVIDGLGHGQFAYQAALHARRFVERHYELPLADLFLGSGRACRGTRGVVMAIACIDWNREQMTFASVGNVEARVFGAVEPVNFLVRRGIIGVNAPPPKITVHHWTTDQILILHSDGLRSHWRLDDFPSLEEKPAPEIAMTLLGSLSRDNDDATVLVVRGKES